MRKLLHFDPHRVDPTEVTIHAPRPAPARSLTTAALDAVDAPAVSLDSTGQIVAVNTAWRQSAAAGGAPQSAVGVGVSYLTMCDRAVGQGSECAAEVAAGIRSVLCGDRDRFSIDYPCDSPERQRWFNVRVAPAGPWGGGAVVTHLEVTGLKHAEQDVARVTPPLHRVFDESAPIFVLVGPDGVVRYVSAATTELIGLRASELVGTSALRQIAPPDRDRAVKAFARVMASPGGREVLHLQVLDVARRRREIELVALNLIDDPDVGAVVLTGSDVSESRYQQIARRLEVRLVHQLPVAVIVTDDRGVIVYWNDRAATTYGYTAAEAVGRPIGDLDGDASHTLVGAEVRRSLAATGRWEGDREARRADGSIVPVHATLERVDDPEIGFHGVVGASLDISDRRRLEESLAFQALHDPLTGLANRRLFVEHLDAALARCGRNRATVAVLFIDLDDFKAVNDTFGHRGGDQLLVAVGDALTGALRDGDMVARLGGDEFAICCDDLADPADAFVVADQVRRAVRAPVALQGTTVEIGASIGIALSSHRVSGDTMLRNADAAMYSAKEVGKGRVELFDDALHDQIRERHQMAMALEDALDAGQVETWFQPQVDLRSAQLVGFEALARWRHPVHGHIPPDRFVPVAEESGLIRRLGAGVLAEACQALATWSGEGPAGEVLTVSVNVSPRQLSDPHFAAEVRDTVRAAGVEPHRVCLEVTESALMEVDAASEALRRLKRVGVTIAIDDFGTGYSSLSRLRGLPVDLLKIDRSFVAGMDRTPEDRIIVTTVIGLAHSLGLTLVAEGIEEPEQLTQLAAEGCEVGQGYYWSPAVPVAAATAMVRGTGRRVLGSD